MIAMIKALLVASAAALQHHDEMQLPLFGYEEPYYAGLCPEYTSYAATPHRPRSDGPLRLPMQRPIVQCRTFTSPAVERTIEDFSARMKDKDLARIFENAFPNTLDTTVKWHVNTTHRNKDAWDGPQTFIVTGDINAEWLRDSTNQLAQYQSLAKEDRKLQSLILGAINTQAEYVIESPYCNAFQPPPPSDIGATGSGQNDEVHPAYEQSRVFECKYELDSLAHFLALGNTFFNSTGNREFLHSRYYLAVETILEVIAQQSRSTFHPKTGRVRKNEYTFRRLTNTGTETLTLNGVGNPLAAGTGLARSAFRPSDDATIFGFFIPANAQMAVELLRTAETLRQAEGPAELIDKLQSRGEKMRKGVWEHGVVQHGKFGEVFAYEVDGYGSSVIMDDANIPSLLALPLLGFVERENKVYQNTRRMILSRVGNPYYLEGKGFSGIGGPHVGLLHAWPMARLVQAMTSDDDAEILRSLHDVRDISTMGLINEGVNVERPADYSRPWFAWANSVFAQTILDVAARKPHLLFE